MIYRSKDFYEKIKSGPTPIKDDATFQSLLKGGSISDEELLEAFSDFRLGIGKNLKLDNICFLMGNGCSIYAGSKSTLDFKMSDAVDPSTYSTINDIDSHLSGKPLEEQLNDLLTIRDYFGIMKDSKEKIISDVIGALKKYLLSNYVNSVEYKKLSLHEILFLKLRSFGCLNRVRLYTANYDLALEYILDKLSIEYADGFSGFVNRKFDPRSLERGNSVKLIKFHGSINWIYDADENAIKEVQPHFTADGKVKVEDAEHVLIYPTEQKLYQTYNAPYSELMRNMLDGFEANRNAIFVLGYKYGDEHINEILVKALTNPNNIFYFFDYDGGNCDFIKRVMKLSESTNNINILLGNFLGDFATFVKYLLPATEEKTDQERLLELLDKVMSHGV